MGLTRRRTLNSPFAKRNASLWICRLELRVYFDYTLCHSTYRCAPKYEELQNKTKSTKNKSALRTRSLPFYIHSQCPTILKCLRCSKGYPRRYSDSLQAERSEDRIPVRGEIFRTRPDRPWGPPRLLYNVYRVSFQGGKTARA